MSEQKKKMVKFSAFMILIVGMHLVHHWWLNRKWEQAWIDTPQAQSCLVGRDLFTAWNSLQTIQNKEDDEIIKESRQFSEETLNQSAQKLLNLCEQNPKVCNRWAAGNLAYAWQYHQQYGGASESKPSADTQKLVAQIQDFLLTYMKAHPADDQFILEIAGEELRYEREAALLLESDQAKPGQGTKEPSNAEKKRIKAIQYAQRNAKNRW